MVNTITLSGELVTDLSERKADNGTPVTSFRILHRYTEDKRVFIEVEAWGWTAQAISGKLSKGSSVIVYGRIGQDDWFKDGKRRSKHKIIANKVIPRDGTEE